MGSPISGYKSDVYVSALPSIAQSNEMCVYDSSVLPSYTQYHTSTHRQWDMYATTTVQTSTDGTTWITVTSGFTWYPAGGVVVFSTAQTGATQVRVSGRYFNMSRAALCHTWELTLTSKTVDVTDFQSDWEKSVTTVTGGVAKITSFIVDDTYISQLGGTLSFMFYTDTGASQAWVFNGFINGGVPKSDAVGVVEQEIDAISNTKPFFMNV